MKNKTLEQPQKPRLGKLKNGNPPCDLSQLPKCTAIAKHSGKQCKQPAMSNGKCYWHGGRSTGAPKGNRNAYKHGQYTAEEILFRQELRRLIKTCEDIVEECRSSKNIIF